MFYINTENGKQIPAYDDEIFTRCTNCGKEIHLKPDELASIILDCGLGGTAVRCTDCKR